MTIDDPPATVECLPGNRVRVETILPSRPTQIAVDPDQILVDPEPANNYWKAPCHFRASPLCTLLDETDLTTSYDRWNIIFGPWLFSSAYQDPWYERSPMAGVRLTAYRTQQFDGGVYAAYRTDYRDIVAGVDGLLDHWPFSHTQVGFNAERSLTTFGDDRTSDRGVMFGRYVFQYGDSLYLPPMHYLELFGEVSENNLPLPRHPVACGDHFDHIRSGGVHYHLDYLTPYWDPEGGFRLDATYASGFAVLGAEEGFNAVDGQFSFVKCLPDGLGWLSETHLAARVYGALGLPSRAELFTLGGATLFRGFDLKERQGNAAWVASLEWRFPILQGLTWDCCDHAVGLRNINGALFYDAGDAYLCGHSLGPVAHAVGAGLRLDVAWFSFVERSTIRFDVAQALGGSTPVQFWLGFQVPF
jgi:outer membrane protein assembly factor BamA